MSMIGPGPTVAPCVSVTHVSVTIQGGYQYAVVSWTDPSLSSTTFKWGSTTGFRHQLRTRGSDLHELFLHLHRKSE